MKWLGLIRANLGRNKLRTALTAAAITLAVALVCMLLTSLSKKDRMERVAVALGVVGLQDRMDHYPRQLSGGQEQRVAIARAIVTDPALILADEPTGNLDAASAQEVLTVLAKLNKDYGKTIVMVTHDPHAAQFASQVYHLEKGELVAPAAQG